MPARLCALEKRRGFCGFSLPRGRRPCRPNQPEAPQTTLGKWKQRHPLSPAHGRHPATPRGPLPTLSDPAMNVAESGQAAQLAARCLQTLRARRGAPAPVGSGLGAGWADQTCPQEAQQPTGGERWLPECSWTRQGPYRVGRGLGGDEGGRALSPGVATPPASGRSQAALLGLSAP